MKISLTEEEVELVRGLVSKIKYDEKDPSRYYNAKMVKCKIKDQIDISKEVQSCEHDLKSISGIKTVCTKCGFSNKENWMDDFR